MLFVANAHSQSQHIAVCWGKIITDWDQFHTENIFSVYREIKDDGVALKKTFEIKKTTDLQ